MYNSILDSLIIGKKIIYLPSCHSTNDIAAELVLNGLAEEGTVVITDNQFAGKGQRGSEWYSEPSKNLTFSLIIRPAFVPIHQQFLLSQWAALSIYDYFSAYTDQVKIKWPNDVYISNQKVSGTLIENSVQGTVIAHAVIGIGININQINFPNQRSTSLREILGYDMDLQTEFGKLIHILDAKYVMLKTMRNNQHLRTDYLKNLYGFGQTVLFKYQNKETEGMVTGITDIGKLCVQFKGQEDIHEFGLKEIEWVWE